MDPNNNTEEWIHMTMTDYSYEINQHQQEINQKNSVIQSLCREVNNQMNAYADLKSWYDHTLQQVRNLSLERATLQETVAKLNEERKADKEAEKVLRDNYRRLQDHNQTLQDRLNHMRSRLVASENALYELRRAHEDEEEEEEEEEDARSNPGSMNQSELDSLAEQLAELEGGLSRLRWENAILQQDIESLQNMLNRNEVYRQRVIDAVDGYRDHFWNTMQVLGENNEFVAGMVAEMAARGIPVPPPPPNPNPWEDPALTDVVVEEAGADEVEPYIPRPPTPYPTTVNGPPTIYSPEAGGHPVPNVTSTQPQENGWVIPHEDGSTSDGGLE